MSMGNRAVQVDGAGHGGVTLWRGSGPRVERLAVEGSAFTVGRAVSGGRFMVGVLRRAN
jgi:hypothetical protein